MADTPTLDEIATLMGRSLTAEEEELAALYIEFAEGEIETWLDRPIHPTAFTDENYFPDANGTVYFKNTPVISLDRLVVNGTTENNNFFTLTTYGLENIFEQSWDYATWDGTTIDYDYLYGPTLIVDYTAGLDYPVAIKSLVSRVVVAGLRENAQTVWQSGTNAYGVKQVQVEDFMVTFFPLDAAGSVSMFSDPDAAFKSIKRLKKRRWG